MLHPTTTANKLKKCCKKPCNLDFSYGDGVSFEVYLCVKCDTELMVDIEIVRDYENIVAID